MGNAINLGLSPSNQDSFVKRETSVQCEPAERVSSVLSKEKEKSNEKSKEKEKSPEPKEISIQTVDFKPQKIPMPK